MHSLCENSWFNSVYYKHYAQIVWAETDQLGCGKVVSQHKDGYKIHIICNYAVAANLEDGSIYKVGQACSACPGDCDDGLCSSTTSGNDTSGCKTTNGLSCVFPFIYAGVEYSQCTTVENGETPWCSTETDKDGNHIETDKDGKYIDHWWRVCAKDCPAPKLKPRPNPPNSFGCKTEIGTNCVFPFIYKGVKYSKCTTVDYGDTPWCSTRTDTEGNHYQGIFWGNCAQDCPSSSLTTTTTTPGQFSYVEKRSIFLLSQSFYSLTYA